MIQGCSGPIAVLTLSRRDGCDVSTDVPTQPYVTRGQDVLGLVAFRGRRVALSQRGRRVPNETTFAGRDLRVNRLGCDRLFNARQPARG